MMSPALEADLTCLTAHTQALFGFSSQHYGIELGAQDETGGAGNANQPAPPAPPIVVEAPPKAVPSVATPHHDIV